MHSVTYMALLRAALAGLTTLVACCWIGQTGQLPSDAPGVARPIHVSRDPYLAPSPTTTTTAPAPLVRASRASVRPRPSAVVMDDAFWRRLANCESSDGRSSASGKYHGFFQFSLTSWRSAGGTGVPADHPYEYQLAIAKAWAARTNPWRQWPTCWPKAVRG